MEQELHAVVAAAWLFGLGSALFCSARWRAARRWLWALAALCAISATRRGLLATGYDGPWDDALALLSACSIVLLSAVLLVVARRSRDVERQHLRMQDVFHAAADAIWVLDEHGRTVSFNPAAARLTGWDPAEIIGRSSHEVVHHSRADGSPYPIEECPIYHSVHDGTPCQVDDEVFWRKDGTSFPVEYTSTPIVDTRGRRIGAVQVFRDIAAQQEVEQRLRAARVAEDRRRQAFEINDTVVQHLVVADMALAMGRPSEAAVSLQAGLADAKRIINDWAGDEPEHFVRRTAAPSSDAEESHDA